MRLVFSIRHKRRAAYPELNLQAIVDSNRCFIISTISAAFLRMFCVSEATFGIEQLCELFDEPVLVGAAIVTHLFLRGLSAERKRQENQEQKVRSMLRIIKQRKVSHARRKESANHSSILFCVFLCAFA